MLPNSWQRWRDHIRTHFDIERCLRCISFCNLLKKRNTKKIRTLFLTQFSKVKRKLFSFFVEKSISRLNTFEFQLKTWLSNTSNGCIYEIVMRIISRMDCTPTMKCNRIPLKMARANCNGNTCAITFNKMSAYCIRFTFL